MSGHPFQTIGHDASISAEVLDSECGVLLIQVDVGELVHVELNLDVDEAAGLCRALQRAITECMGE